jgi:SAM-dependent methyltransferase
MPKDVWDIGESYEVYVGRWSRQITREFLSWLNVPTRVSWLDVGCGTGAISHAIVSTREPKLVLGLDRSGGFVQTARASVDDRRCAYALSDAQSLCVRNATFDVAVSGLVLNFVPDQARMIHEMAASLRPGGIVGVYVWDYGGTMEMLQYFWDAAKATDTSASHLDEAERFPICRPEPLRELFSSASLQEVEARGIEIETSFASFDDYWRPFLGGQGAAPAYAATLEDVQLEALCEHLRRTVPIQTDGSIVLRARVWAAKGKVAS